SASFASAPRRRKVRSARDALADIPRCAPLRLLSGRDPLRWARVRVLLSWTRYPDPCRRPASPQAPHRSLPPGGESSFTPLRLLSPHNPLRWAFAGAPDLGRLGGQLDAVSRSLSPPQITFLRSSSPTI